MAAKEAALKDVSKSELAEAYSKLKARTKNAQTTAKKEGEALIQDAITVGAGGGLGYLMGDRAGGIDQSLTGEAREDALADAQQVGGIDLDLLVGGAAAAIGLMKLGGKMSDTVRAVGIGGLTEYAGRVAYDKAETAAIEGGGE